jgi:hypothetical protein
LVHEFLVEVDSFSWQDRAHFFRFRRRDASDSGGLARAKAIAALRLNLNDVPEIASVSRDPEIVAMDEALAALAQTAVRWLRYAVCRDPLDLSRIPRRTDLAHYLAARLDFAAYCVPTSVALPAPILSIRSRMVSSSACVYRIAISSLECPKILRSSATFNPAWSARVAFVCRKV